MCNCGMIHLAMIFACTTFETDSEDLEYLEFLELNNTLGVVEINLPQVDDGDSGPITITGGFPFGSSIQDVVYVCQC